jgi:hypothetical protein
MHNRLRLLKLATALLYFGPLLAGLMGQGWGMVLAFTTVFLIWSLIIRPHLWPRSVSDLGRSDSFVSLATLVTTQLLLVIACFAVGRGIGGVLAVKPTLPPYLPLALSFLSVPLSRLIWNPRVMAENVGFDPILHDPAATSEDPAALAGEMLAQVMALPDDVAEDVVQGHLTAISAHLDPVVIRRTLGDAVARGVASRASIKALIVHATDPADSDLMSGSAYPAQAFAAAGRDPELLGLFARRCTLALGHDADLVADCPSAEAVSVAARDCRDTTTATELNRLGGLLG